MARPLWDLLILTARNEEQRYIFNKELNELTDMLQKYCREWTVIADRYDNIGSGLATGYVCTYIREKVGNASMGTVLLIHSGGLSKRLPHVSPFGKVFARIPGGNTLLEEKLFTFRELPRILKNGLFVASSDTIETLHLIDNQKFDGLVLESAPSAVDGKKMLHPTDYDDTTDKPVAVVRPRIVTEIPESTDTTEDIDAMEVEELPSPRAKIILFGHVSEIAVGRQHGVFVLDEAVPENCTGRLLDVLQKPTLKEMNEKHAINANGTVITDSTFFLAQEVVYKLSQVTEAKETPPSEICCYADFMRPLGSRATYGDYVSDPTGDEAVNAHSSWQVTFFDFFHGYANDTAVIVDQNAEFYHFGTPSEFLTHLSPEGGFFREDASRAVKCINWHTRDDVHIDNTSYLEFSLIPHGIEIPPYVLLSHVRINDSLKIRIPGHCTIFTWKLKKESKFVTIMFENSVDIKKVEDKLKWYRHDVKSPASLYTAKIFPTADTPEESLLRTLGGYRDGIKSNGISIEEAIQNVDTKWMLRARKDPNGYGDVSEDGSESE